MRFRLPITCRPKVKLTSIMVALSVFGFGCSYQSESPLILIADPAPTSHNLKCHSADGSWDFDLADAWVAEGPQGPTYHYKQVSSEGGLDVQTIRFKHLISEDYILEWNLESEYFYLHATVIERNPVKISIDVFSESEESLAVGMEMSSRFGVSVVTEKGRAKFVTNSDYSREALVNRERFLVEFLGGILDRDVVRAPHQSAFPLECAELTTSNELARGEFGPQTEVVAGKRAAEYGKKIAVVIGVSDYQFMSSEGSGAGLPDELNDLRFAESDALSFVEMLRNEAVAGGKWEVRSLTGDEATEQSVGTLLDEVFAGPLRERDLLYFFFAGHARVNPLNARDVRLMLYDSDPKLNRAGISYTEVRRSFLESTAGYAVAFVDACRSGSIEIARGSGRPDQDLLGGLQEIAPAKVIITAGSGSERAFEDPDLGHGVFTHFLLRGLGGEAADSDRDMFVDLDELEGFLGQEVAGYTANHPRMSRQRPRVWYEGDLNAGRFPLAVRN
jgi:hypothetical protein